MVRLLKEDPENEEFKKFFEKAFTYYRNERHKDFLSDLRSIVLTFSSIHAIIYASYTYEYYRNNEKIGHGYSNTPLHNVISYGIVHLFHQIRLYDTSAFVKEYDRHLYIDKGKLIYEQENIESGEIYTMEILQLIDKRPKRFVVE
jgi:hypothetical protein